MTCACVRASRATHLNKFYSLKADLQDLSYISQNCERWSGYIRTEKRKGAIRDYIAARPPDPKRYQGKSPTQGNTVHGQAIERTCDLRVCEGISRIFTHLNKFHSLKADLRDLSYISQNCEKWSGYIRTEKGKGAIREYIAARPPDPKGNNGRALLKETQFMAKQLKGRQEITQSNRRTKTSNSPRLALTTRIEL
jgi:hypothetical protein